MRSIAAVALACSFAAHAQPAGCPHDATGDRRVDIEDLYHLTQNPADINGDGVADAEDAACLESYLRCVELLDMSFRPGGPAADLQVPSLEYRENGTGGLAQTLRVVRTPSPDGLACFSQNWTTTLLGTRPGLAGPVEIRLHRDGFLWQGLFADAASTSPGSTTTSNMLTCDGSAIELVAATPGGTVGSADPLRALVLLDGQSVTDQAVAKGLVDAASRDIGGGLIDAYTAGGVVTLPTRGMLVLFELDGTASSDPAFAFDDAAVLVEVGCGAVDDATPQEVVLRDSITSDPGYTSWNGSFPVRWTAGNPRVVAFEVSASELAALKELRAVLVNSAPPGTQLAWSQFDYRIYAWEDWTTAFANPTQGTLGTYVVPDLIEPEQAWGQVQTQFGPRDSFLIRVDGSSTAITVPAGGSIVLGFSIATGTSSGTPEVCESDEIAAGDDYRFNGSIWTTTFDYPGRLEDGRLGVKVIVETN